MSAKTEPVLCFTAKQGHSSLSFSGLTGESSAGDYQDCGASSMLLMGEPSWCSPCPENSFNSANHNSAVMWCWGLQGKEERITLLVFSLRQQICTLLFHFVNMYITGLYMCF